MAGRRGHSVTTAGVRQALGAGRGTAGLDLRQRGVALPQLAATRSRASGQSAWRIGRRPLASEPRGSCRLASHRRASHRCRCRALWCGAHARNRRVLERGHHLVLHVGWVGAVIAAQPPGRQQEAATLHVLGQACSSPPGEDAATTGRIDAPCEHDHAVADRPNRAPQGPKGNNLGPQRDVIQILAHPLRMSARQEQAVKFGLARSDPK